jgi:lipoprotein-releasing system ATP-binding protein
MQVVVETVTKSYLMADNKRREVLKNFSYTFENATKYAIVGESGVGKSTLLHLIGTLDDADSGDIKYNLSNEGLKNRKEIKDIAKFRNLNLGFIFQFHNLLPELTAIENVVFPGLINNKNKKDVYSRAKYLLDFVGLESKYEQYPSELSGGENQRVALARAFINSPELIIADEPTGNLDEMNTQNTLNLINKLYDEKPFTMIIATHSKFVADAMDKTIEMKKS